MGYRAHVCKTHKIEYADGEWFNYQADEVVSFLIEEANAEAPVEKDSVEIDREKLRKLIARMRDPENERHYELVLWDNGIKGTSVKEMADILETWANESDQENYWVHVEWF